MTIKTILKKFKNSLLIKKRTIEEKNNNSNKGIKKSNLHLKNQKNLQKLKLKSVIMKLIWINYLLKISEIKMPTAVEVVKITIMRSKFKKDKQKW